MARSHTCPAPGCPLVISVNLFACRSHWYDLSKAVRDAIWATAGLGTLHPDRRAAIHAAFEDWEAGSTGNG